MHSILFLLRFLWNTKRCGFCSKLNLLYEICFQTRDYVDKWRVLDFFYHLFIFDLPMYNKTQQDCKIHTFDSASSKTYFPIELVHWALDKESYSQIYATEFQSQCQLFLFVLKFWELIIIYLQVNRRRQEILKKIWPLRNIVL